MKKFITLGYESPHITITIHGMEWVGKLKRWMCKKFNEIDPHASLFH